MSFFPSIDNEAPIWLLAATNVEGTQVKVTYLEDGTADQFVISPNKPKEYRIKTDLNADDKHQMAKPNAWEVKQKRSVHVEASHPISLQGFTDADNNVGLFLILPSANLGQKYTISAFNDQHSRMSDGGGGFGGWEPSAFPPTGGGFIVVATEDNTSVTMRVTGPTAGGRRPGEQWTINMEKGDTYYVRGAAESEEDDLSRSTVTATKPVAVFAGCEIARTLDAMVLSGHFDYNDYIVEQMIPQEIWGKEYVSGPFTNKRGTKEDDLWGDFYRVYASEPTELFMDGSSRGVSDYWEFSLQTVPRIFSADKPIMVVQYDYYIDFHGLNPKSPRTSNNEMVLVPRHNWRRNATFTVPKGYSQTYFHVIAHRDSIDKITAILPGKVTPAPISGMKYPGAFTYNIGPYRIYTLVLGVTGQVRVQGPCDFAVYNYGTRDNDAIKATYSYASAAAASFGSLTNAKPPRMVMDSTCTEFNLKFFNTDVDARGMGDMYLLNDPDGLIYRNTPYVSKNVTLDVTKYGFGADTVFAKVTIIDPLQDAFAALYVTNRAGKDTVYTFTYSGSKIDITPDSLVILNTLVGQTECKIFTLKNTGKNEILINGFKFEKQSLGVPTPFTASAAGLPTLLKPGQTIEITACFNPKDTGVWYNDTLQVEGGCFTADVALIKGIGKVPIIFAEDKDFGVVDIGETVCKDIEIQNMSYEKELILTKDILKAVDEFTIAPSELARFPITLAPRAKTVILICYTPTDEGTDSAFVVWGRDIPEPYSDTNRKEWSVLTGKAQRAGVSVVGKADTLICGGPVTLMADLRNTGSGPANIKRLFIDGTDKSEFVITKVENLNNGDWDGAFSFDLPALTGQRDVTIEFNVDPADPNPWRIHRAMLLAPQLEGGEIDTAYLSVDMRSPIVAAEPLVDMGIIGEGETSTGTVTITNTGNYEFKVKSISFQTGGIFTITSGLAVGDVIPAGESRTVNLSATSALAGNYTDELLVEGERCRETKTALAMIVKRYEVTAAGADIPATWTCRENNEYDVTFTNNSSDPVKLTGVEMQPGGVNASQITFGTPDVGTVIFNGTGISFPGGERVVAANETVRIPVLFASSIVGNASVNVHFRYKDRDNLPQLLERQITAIGKNYPVDLSVSGAAYRGTNDVELEVPIVLNQTNLFDAEVYGYEFDLTFNEDNFKVADVQQGNGHLTPTFAEVGKTNVGGVDYTTIRVTATGSRLENDENILARVILLTRLTTENTTTIVPSNFRFLDQNGQAACWTPKTELGNDYTYDPLCGDKSLQEYLAKGISFLQNNSIAPNPAKNSSVYAFDLHANDVVVSVGVYDALGNQVASVLNEKTLNTGHHELAIDLTTLPAGTYYVRTNAGEGWVATQKLTVQK